MNKREKIKSDKQYDTVMSRIERLLEKATKKGGFDKLSDTEKKVLKDMSVLAEEYEDSIPMMPIEPPKTLSQMIRYKMYERNLKQKQLAELLDISEPTMSGLLSGKRQLTFELAKKLHFKLDIDAEFLLETA